MLKRLSILAPPLLFIVAAIVVHHELKAFQTGDIRDAIFAVPPLTIAIGAILTALNYAILSFYDWLALRYAGQHVPIRKVLLASSISYAISNNTGHALISGTSVRYRFYTNWGVPGWEVVRISAFLAMTFIIGLITTEVLTFLAVPPRYMSLIATPGAVHIITALCALGVVAYWAAIYTVRKPIKIRNASFSLPSPMMALLQTTIAVIDITMAGFILYLFLRETVSIPFPAFMMIYVVAMLLGLSSQVPGGLGIFEGTFLWMAGPDFSSAHIIGALIVFRLVYYVLPLCFAGAGLLSHETYRHWREMRSSGERVVIVLKYVVPRVFAPLLALSGALLLFTGAMPNLPGDIAWLRAFVPLGVLEFSHLLGSLIGLLLLIISRGVFLRLDAAYYACIILSSLGIATAILQGLHWYDATILGVLLILFIPSRRYFDRKSSLFTMSFTPFWLFSILVVLAGTAWIGFFSYKHVDYANQLWWKFTFRGDAPRFLRAMALTTVIAVLLALYRLFGVAKVRDITPPTEKELEQARTVAGAALDTTGFLALLADKQLLWSEDGNAFIMYAMTRRYWIAMGDPVGDPSAFQTLIWRFREQSDKHGCKAVFYEVSDQHLPLYLDLGLALLKVGEEARVSLKDFNLEGGKKENQRKTRNRFNKQGFTIRFLENGELKRQLPTLRKISDQWLELKGADEKGFSLGFYDENYLQRTRVAIVTKDEQIYAFANLWALDSRDEIAIDLMRYAPDAPVGTMEYLFVELMLWAQGEGYTWFDLGMAPLSGLERHPLAPLWHKIGTLIYRHGEEFYNFEGLHAYKEKFSPIWRARYLAAPPGLRLPLVLLNTTAVISRPPSKNS